MGPFLAPFRAFPKSTANHANYTIVFVIKRIGLEVRKSRTFRVSYINRGRSEFRKSRIYPLSCIKHGRSEVQKSRITHVFSIYRGRSEFRKSHEIFYGIFLRLCFHIFSSSQNVFDFFHAFCTGGSTRSSRSLHCAKAKSEKRFARASVAGPLGSKDPPFCIHRMC